MAGLPFPFGLRSHKTLGNNYDNQSFTAYPMKNGYAQAVYTGDAIAVSSNGYAKLGAAAQNNLGAAAGFLWIDDTTRQPREAKYFPAGTSAANGRIEGFVDTPIVKVVDNPNTVYAIKANAAVSVGWNGAYVNIANGGTGSNVNGYSSAVADVAALASDTSVSAAVGMLQIIGVYPSDEYVSAGAAEAPVYNTWDAAETVVLVKIANYGFNPVQA
jgi:hypothetical protein